MKQLLLSAAAAMLCTAAATAQTRLTLYEEFSGENCAPCAAYNPGLWTLLSANTSKVMLIKYQSPIPSAGPIYNAYKTVTNNRLIYYNVASAPYGVQNGNEWTGNIASYAQSQIDASVANAAPFAITVTHSWLGTDSIVANVSLSTPNTSLTDATAQYKLRIALVEHLQYCTPPGTNGETEFHNVVREMYPDANGTALTATWTTGQSQNITLKGRVPAFVDKSNDKAVLVVWVQNDANKIILQAAKSTQVLLATDAGLTGCAQAVLGCGAGTTNVTTPVVLTNTGASTLTSAVVYYRLDGGAWTPQPWTGSLAAGTSTTVSLPALAMSGGNHTVSDSVAMPNGAADFNLANNKQLAYVTVHDNTPVTLPVSADFEDGNVPNKWTLFDATGKGDNWTLRSGTGNTNSFFCLYYNFYNFAAGEVAYATLPNTTLPSGAKALDFWEAYAPYNAQYNDKLDVVYSTDCGANWSTVWSAGSTDLATHAATTNVFFPGPDDWRLRSIDMSSVPSGAMVAFRATSGNGNNIFLDDINLRTGAPTAVAGIVQQGGTSLFPNPATGAGATLRFTLARGGRVRVSVTDASGRTVAEVANADMPAGVQQLNISTAALAAGLYNVSIRTENGVTVQRLSVVK